LLLICYLLVDFSVRSRPNAVRASTQTHVERLLSVTPLYSGSCTHGCVGAGLLPKNTMDAGILHPGTGYLSGGMLTFV